MGASNWSYFVPYQENIGKALQDLRSQILQRGDFYLRATRAEMLASLDSELARPLEEQFRFSLHQDLELLEMLREEAITTLNALRSRPEPITEEEKLNEIGLINQESGTHSILDMVKVTAAPEFGSVSPLTPGQLIELFGTDKPTREMVEQDEVIRELPDLRQRWEGAYVILYEKDEPDQIWFFGFSGD